jgi:hypothetical protein
MSVRKCKAPGVSYCVCELSVCRRVFLTVCANCRCAGGTHQRLSVATGSRTVATTAFIKQWFRTTRVRCVCICVGEDENVLQFKCCICNTANDFCTNVGTFLPKLLGFFAFPTSFVS